MNKSYSVAQARNDFTTLFDQVQTEEAVEITRRGKPVAVLMSSSEYAALKQRERKKKGIWEAIVNLRNQLNFIGVDFTNEDIDGLRDRSPGRDVAWPT